MSSSMDTTDLTIDQNDDTSKTIEYEKINNDSTAATSQSKRSTVNPREGNRSGISVATNNLASSTVTIVLERAKPLVLKLRNPDYGLFGLGQAKKPEDDIEKTINALGDELVENVSKTIYAIRDETKQARPRPQQENYQARMEAYQALLGYVTDIINRLGSMFTKSLTEYRRLINELWDDLQRAHNDNEREEYVQQFLAQSEQNFRDALKNDIEPLLESVENELNLLT